MHIDAYYTSDRSWPQSFPSSPELGYIAQSCFRITFTRLPLLTSPCILLMSFSFFTWSDHIKGRAPMPAGNPWLFHKCCIMTLSHMAGPAALLSPSQSKTLGTWNHLMSDALYIEVKPFATAGWFFLIAILAIKACLPSAPSFCYV